MAEAPVQKETSPDAVRVLLFLPDSTTKMLEVEAKDGIKDLEVHMAKYVPEGTEVELRAIFETWLALCPLHYQEKARIKDLGGPNKLLRSILPSMDMIGPVMLFKCSNVSSKILSLEKPTDHYVKTVLPQLNKKIENNTNKLLQLFNAPE